MTGNVQYLCSPTTKPEPEEWGACLITLYVFWDPAVTVRITEIHLSARRQHPVSFLEDAGLMRTEVDDAVADHYVHGSVLDARFIQEFYVALHKLHVARFVS